jgi:hypothetical protein
MQMKFHFEKNTATSESNAYDGPIAFRAVGAPTFIDGSLILDAFISRITSSENSHATKRQ